MKRSKFWRLTSPEYDSDYDQVFINGSLEHLYGLPGVKCGTCGATWGGARVLPVACPEALRSVHELNEAWPISADRHRQLRERVRAELAAEGQACPELKPGDAFQPSFLDVPSTPCADFLWASLESVVISDRMRPLFEELGADVAAVVPVQSRRIGHTRQLVMYDDMAPGPPLFMLATTLWLIVTDAFKTNLERAHPTNVRFEPVNADVV